MGWSNEFKVGVLVLFATGAAVYGTRWSIDGVRPSEQTYTLHLNVPSADGLWVQSGVKLAGVGIGAVSAIKVSGDHAELDLAIRSEHELPVDTVAELRSSGIIGDRYVAIVLGDDEGLLKQDDWLQLKTKPADYEKITQQVEGITDDVKAITAALRVVAENDQNRDDLEATLRNMEAISESLRMLTERNVHDIDAIVASVGRLSATLEGMAGDTRGDVDEEMEKLKSATDSLHKTVDDIRSVTQKIDAGEGTIGALVNDRETIDLVNETIGNANDVIEGYSGLKTEVYYNGRLYFGSQPEDPQFFYGNPLAGGGANILGLRLMPQEDFWYNFEFVDYPQGTITYEERLDPNTGQVHTEWIREPNYRITFMMNKRWKHLGLRLGIKEDGGGIGATWWMLDDRLEFQGDIFDFDLGSYPAIDARGLPNARMLARYRPLPNLYAELGAEQPFLGARYSYYTGFFGFGFHFNDDDIKLLMATLPLNF